MSIRKTLVALVSATVLAGTLSISTSAKAWGPYPYGYGYGYGAAAVAGGLALGALAASAAAASSHDCYYTHQWATDSWGHAYRQRIRVCN